MRILTQTEADNLPNRDSYHVLTYAEEGFAPLNINARRYDLTKDELVEFAEMVNEQEGVWSLYPRAPISAIPRSVIRECSDSAEVLTHLVEFLKLNAAQMKSTHLIFDFRTPKLDQFVLSAIEKALVHDTDLSLDDVVVIEDF